MNTEKLLKIVRYSLPCLCVVAALLVLSVYKDVKRERKKNDKYRELFSYIKDNQDVYFGKISIPRELQMVPMQDVQGVISSVKRVPIRNVKAPYNCALAKREGGYWIFFRYDVIDETGTYPFFSHIGCAKLDANFEQTDEEYFDLNLSSDFTEDPRIVYSGDNLYVMYNSTIDNTYNGRRLMHLAQLDPVDLSVLSETYYDPQFQVIEKNWTPFEYITKEGDSKLLVEYHLVPHVFLHIKDPTEINAFSFLKFKNPIFNHLPWLSHVWGTPRGGTPPLKISDDEYLGFFHSSFRDRHGYIWYLMGAYTFNAEPPFEIRRISEVPILFENIFDSPITNTANPITRCIFPSGMIIEEKDGKAFIHVSCGENDTSMKILTFEKDALLKSLRKF